MRFLRCFLTVGLFTLVTAAPRAATYEVAGRFPQASDDAPGTPEHPWKTISHAASVVKPGDTVRIHGGVYREHVTIKTDGTAEAPIRFEAVPYEPVILTGADHLTGWKKAEAGRPVYSIAWPYRFNTWSKTMTHPGDERHRLIGRCEQVIVNGYPLRQVLELGQIAPGTFFADTENKRLYVWDSANGDLNRATVEAAVRQEILRVEGARVRVRGIQFRYAANSAQHGAVFLGGAHGWLEDCLVEWMNSSGATLAAADLMVRRCTFRQNGQLGFGASRAHHLRFTDCVVADNNTKNFDRGWEAGGNKLVLCRDATLDHCRIIRNHGNGIWFDIGNEACSVVHCLIADNDDAGIFYEISYGLRAADNVIVGNGFAPTSGAWGAQAGISLSSSPDCVIERNLIVGNREGFNFREQNRSTPTIDDRAGRAVWNHDQLIRHNLIAYNRDAQIRGWFDIKDQRHWPVALQQKKDGVDPAGNLEKLNLRFVENVYAFGANEGGLIWGTAWGRHESYSTVSAFEAALHIDHGSRVLTPEFADPLALDFRLPAAELEKVQPAYPQGSVPEARLGRRP